MRRPLLVLSLLAGSPGCSEPVEHFPDLLEIQWEGEHIRFAAIDEAPVCAGTRDFLDDSVGRLEAIRGEDGGRISYFLVSEAELQTVCVGTPTACAANNKAYSTEALVIHELVHNVRYAQEGFPSTGTSVFEEGLADLYDARRSANNRARGGEGSLLIPEDIADRLAANVDERAAPYERVVASFYLSALADTYGDLAVWDFVTQTGELRDGRPLREIFEASFPESFDDFNAEFARPASCSEWAKTRHLLECEQDGPDVDASLDTLILRATEDGVIDCTSPDVVGPRAGEMWTTRTFDVTERIDLAFAGAMSSEDEDEELDLRQEPGEDRVYARLTKCGGGCINWQNDRLLGNGSAGLDLTDRVELEPGRYLVQFVRPYDQPGYSVFTLSSDPNWPFDDAEE